MRSITALVGLDGVTSEQLDSNIEAFLNLFAASLGWPLESIVLNEEKQIKRRRLSHTTVLDVTRFFYFFLNV